MPAISKGREGFHLSEPAMKLCSWPPVDAYLIELFQVVAMGGATCMAFTAS